MQRRGESEQPVKGRRSGASRPKARKSPAAHLPVADFQEKLDQRTRERDEALEQLAATSEVLQVISSSPGKLAPVFQAMLENALRICEARFGTLYLCDGDTLRAVADTRRAPRAYREARKRKPRLSPVPDGPVGGVLITKQVVHIGDLKKLQSYLEHHPTVVDAVELGGFRTALGVPLLRDNELIGVINIMRQEVRSFTDKQIKLVENFAAQAVIAIENARLFNELRQRTDDLSEALEQQTATSEVLQVISSSPGELGPVFETMLANAVRVCGAKFGTMNLYDAGAFRTVAMHNVPPAFAEMRRSNPVFHPSPRTGIGRAAHTKEVVHILDLKTEQTYREREPASVNMVELGGARTLITVPMLKKGEFMGGIAIYRQEVRPFTDKQIELVKNFAAQAVIAIENTRLLNELRHRTDDLSESLEQQTATSEVLKVISSSAGELGPVFDAMLANATRICEAKIGVLYLGDEDNLRAVAATHDAPPAYVEARKQSGKNFPLDGPIRRAASTKQVAHVTDIRELQSYLERHPMTVVSVELGKFRTVLAVPMLKDDELIGVITLNRQEVRPFTDKQIELVQNFAAQAVIAIENTRLLNELRQRTDDLSESLEQQTATSEVLRVISSSTSELQPVFQAVLANATRLCAAKFGLLYLREGDALRATAMHNVPPAFAEARQRDPLVHPEPGSMLDRLSRSRRTIHIPDVTADAGYIARLPRFVMAVELGGFRAMLAVPMLKDANLIGVIIIYRQEPGTFTDKQIELVQNFAAQAVIAIENTRLLSELRQRTDDLTESLEQQTATSEVLKVISSSPGELEPVFNAMLENAVRICDAKFGVLFLTEGDAFRYVALHGAPPAFAAARRREPVTRVKPGTTIGRVAATKKPAQTADIRAEPAYTSDPERYPILELAGARTILGVPMLKESQLVGAIVIYRQEVRPFTDKQIDLLSNFAAQAIIAIENTRLLNELRESLQQQTATSEVLKVISSSPGELEPVFQAMLENATRICEARFGNLVLYENENGAFRMAAMHGAPPEFAEKRGREPIIHPSPKSPLFRVAKTRQLLHIIDLRIDEAYVDGDLPTRAFVELAGTRTIVVVPMLKDDKLIGAIGIYRQEVRAFTDKQIELLKNFAAQAVIAIENTRLLSELRESLQQQTATADVLKVISRSTFDLRTVLQTLVESAARLCDADKATITRQKDGAFYSAETYGFSSEFMDYIRKIPIVPERGLASGRALLEGRLVHIPDVKADPEYTLLEGQRLGEYRTILAVPMLREGTPIGVLILTRSEVRPFTDKQIELVSTFADQAAIAIENVRLFESVEARTRELAASLENLRTTQDRLVQTQKLASLGQLTAGIAHEIKNPLNFVNNFSGVSAELIDELQEALKDVNLNEKRRKEINELTNMLRGNLDKVVQHGKRADAIVKNMLLHSREGSGEHRLVDINTLVEESLNLAYHGARAEKQGFNITLERSFDPTTGEADVFPQDITRALLNLILNGFYAATKRKAEANGGDYEPTVTAATRNLGDRVEIRIRDNGTGIPPEVKEKIFNPFFTTKPAGEGTGLGLSISHDIIVKQHGGAIEVDTQLGEFTEFKIILPRTAATIAKSGERS